MTMYVLNCPIFQHFKILSVIMLRIQYYCILSMNFKNFENTEMDRFAYFHFFEWTPYNSEVVC